MVEIDSDTYQVKMVRDESKASPPRFLMTPERSQNLDLLQHLLANFEHPVALCGPEGVGKTALLGVLQKRLEDEWRWCIVNAHGGMIFEEVRDRVETLLKNHRPEAPGKNTGHGRLQDVHRDVVLVIDDAGEMAPGLLTHFLQFAENHLGLRLLFVLTHDQWHIKSCTDPAIENCFIVEAKPLPEKECRDFVQHVASASSRLGKGLTDTMIDAAYRESHGIPGKMIAHFPELNKSRESPDSLKFLIVAVVCMVSLAFYMQWRTASVPVDQQGVATDQPGGSKTHFDSEQPILSLPVGNALKDSQNPELSSVQPEGAASMDLIGQEVGRSRPESIVTEASAPVSADNMAKSVDQQQVLSDTVAPALSQELAAQAEIGGDAESWLAARSENSYALQLMILSKASIVQDVIARHAELQTELRVVRRLWKGKEKFVLLYGDFADIESAKSAKKSLPAEFKSAMIRKFGAIRKEFPSVPKH